MQARLWLCAWMLVGCAAKSTRPETKPPETVAKAGVKAADPELVAVADAVDPGPQQPLFDALPTWLKSKVGATPDRAVAVKKIREALLVWDKLKAGSAETFMTPLLSLGRGLVLAEQAVASGADDAELLVALSRAYSILSSPMFASETGMGQQILQFMAVAAAQSKEAGAVDAAEVVTGLREVFKRAPLLHRRAAAELLRRHGDHPEVPRVLGRLADDRANLEQFAEALRLRKMSLTRMGAAAKGTDQLDLAGSCYKALEPACGDAALARGKAIGSDTPDDKKAALAFATRAEKLVELGGQARALQTSMADPRAKDPAQVELSVGLERGRLLIALAHYAEARALFEGLKAAHPGDARPLTGLAKVALTSQGDLTAGIRWIDAGRKLANRDRDYYEVALGVFGSKLLTEVMPAMMRPDSAVKPMDLMGPMLDDMKEYATGYQLAEPARGAVILEFEAILRLEMPLLAGKKDAEIWPIAVRELLARTKVLAQRFPESADVRRMIYLAANVSDDKAAALAMVKAPLTGKLASDEALQRGRVQAWLDVVMVWDAVEEVPALLAAAKLLPAEGDWQRTRLVAMAQALQVRLSKDPEVGLATIKMFEAVAFGEGVSDEAKVAAVCNSGTILAWFGEAEAAKQRYEAVLEQDPRSVPALVGMATLYSAAGVHEPKVTEIFEAAVREADNTTMRVQSLAWLYTLAKAGYGDVEVARRMFIEVVNKPRGSEARGTVAFGRMGAYSRGSWTMNMQWQSTLGFQLINETQSTQYLMLPSPDTEALIAAAAAAKKKPAKSKK